MIVSNDRIRFDWNSDRRRQLGAFAASQLCHGDERANRSWDTRVMEQLHRSGMIIAPRNGTLDLNSSDRSNSRNSICSRGLRRSLGAFSHRESRALRAVDVWTMS
jgi:hypothetical protein